PEYRARGFPIGSGAVESANKVVVEARLKGAGMHWERSHVNPMLALRNAVCSHRWEEAWEQIARGLREQATEKGTARRNRRERKEERGTEEAASVLAASDPTTAEGGKAEAKGKRGRGAGGERQRPAADHPWRRFRIGRATVPS